MHIFSKALIFMPLETITEQLKVLSALGRQELQTGGRSGSAEPTEAPGRRPKAGAGVPGSGSKRPALSPERRVRVYP